MDNLGELVEKDQPIAHDPFLVPVKTVVGHLRGSTEYGWECTDWELRHGEDSCTT